MRAAALAALGVVGGFVVGVVLSDLIAMVGVFVFDRVAGVRFLPLYLAVACAVGGPPLDRRSRSRRRG